MTVLGFIIGLIIFESTPQMVLTFAPKYTLQYPSCRLLLPGGISVFPPSPLPQYFCTIKIYCLCTSSQQANNSQPLCQGQRQPQSPQGPPLVLAQILHVRHEHQGIHGRLTRPPVPGHHIGCAGPKEVQQKPLKKRSHWPRFYTIR